MYLNKNKLEHNSMKQSHYWEPDNYSAKKFFTYYHAHES
jgi:hypothetical protein